MIAIRRSVFGKVWAVMLDWSFVATALLALVAHLAWRIDSGTWNPGILCAQLVGVAASMLAMEYWISSRRRISNDVESATARPEEAGGAQATESCFEGRTSPNRKAIAGGRNRLSDGGVDAVPDAGETVGPPRR